MLSYLVNQYKHMHWANQKLITVLRQENPAPAEAIKLMGHIVSAEHIWLARINGQTEILAPWIRLALPECEDYEASNDAGYHKIISNLNEERLHDPIAFKLISGNPMTSTLGDILCHVPVHGSHHRGQIARILAQNNIAPTAIDYIVFSMQTDG